MRVFKHSLLLVILVITSFNSIAALPNNINGKALPTLAPLIKKVSPAVVDISVFGKSTATPGVPNDLLEFLQPQRPPQQFSGLGSGVIIDAQQGYIITNYHVIENADDIVISLTSGHQYKATVIGQDPQSDIALLQIKTVLLFLRSLYSLPI